MKYENAQIKIAELADYFSGIHVHFSPYFFPLLLYLFFTPAPIVHRLLHQTHILIIVLDNLFTYWSIES